MKKLRPFIGKFLNNCLISFVSNFNKFEIKQRNISGRLESTRAKFLRVLIIGPQL